MSQKTHNGYDQPIERIAMIGGKDFDGYSLDKFLKQLYAKYPRAVIVTGNGLGAERSILPRAEQAGFTVEVPPVYPERYGKEALMCQINDIMLGANVIVTVGSEKSTRPKRALEIWKRCDSLLNPWNKRPYFNVAKPIAQAKPKAKPRRRPKKREELFV